MFGSCIRHEGRECRDRDWYYGRTEGLFVALSTADFPIALILQER